MRISEKKTSDKGVNSSESDSIFDHQSTSMLHYDIDKSTTRCRVESPQEVVSVVPHSEIASMSHLSRQPASVKPTSKQTEKGQMLNEGVFSNTEDGDLLMITSSVPMPPTSHNFIDSATSPTAPDYHEPQHIAIDLRSFENLNENILKSDAED